jgi:hypothetical protein
MNHIATRRHERVAPKLAANARCACCGSLLPHRAATPFCAECLELARAHDSSDPYDELGEGD